MKKEPAYKSKAVRPGSLPRLSARRRMIIDLPGMVYLDVKSRYDREIHETYCYFISRFLEKRRRGEIR